MWYRAKDGAQQGPFSGEEIERAIAAGGITSQTLLWRSGFDGWRPAGTVAEFETAFAAAHAPDTPPPLPVSGPPPLPPSRPAAVPTPPPGASAASPTFPRPPVPRAAPTPAAAQPAAAQAEAEDIALGEAGGATSMVPEEIELRLKPAATPWSRYWARMLDSVIVGWLMVGGMFVLAVTAPTSGIVRAANGEGGQALWGVGGVALLCVFTAICLRLFGSTPGKSLYRIDVTPMGWTGRPTGFAGREARAFFAGLGIGFPIASLCTMIWQHSRLRRALPASYDEGRFLVTQRPLGRGRFGLGVLLTLLGLASFVALGLWGDSVSREAAAPKVFNNTVTGESTFMPPGWQLSEALGTEQDPVWVLVNIVDGSAVVFGLEHLPVGFSDSVEDATIYAEAVADAFGPEGANEIKIAFDACVPATIDTLAIVRCPGTTVETKARSEIVAFLDPPLAWRVVVIGSGPAPATDKDTLVSALASTTN